MSSVRVAIVGVGNCAASLVQGVHYYRDADPTSTVPGLMHVQFGDYHVRDIEFVAAFDVDAKKVGFDLADAIRASENNTIKIADVPPLGIPVQRGHTFDGLGKYYRETITESDEAPVDVVQLLRDAKADVLVSYLPVGSEDADKFYAQCAIDAGVAFVNALPVFIASDPEWAQKFADAGVPIVGDDIKSQVGATITHRVLTKLFEDRGVEVQRTYQLNVGGNMDFKNMLERDRLESKKISKTQSVTSQIRDRDLGSRNVHIGPSDYVAWLDDRKWAFVRIEGKTFGDVPLNIEYKLEVWDSPNSAGIIIDALRAAKIAKDRGIGGPVLSASSYFMKSPPVQYYDDEARQLTVDDSFAEEAVAEGVLTPEQAAKSPFLHSITHWVGPDSPARPPRTVTLRPPQARPLFERLLWNIELWLTCERIHGDLSPFNILYWEGRLTVIDFPQAVDQKALLRPIQPRTFRLRSSRRTDV